MNESRVPALDQGEGAGGDTSGDQTHAVRVVRRRRRVDPVAAPEAPADGAADGSVARTGPAGGQRRRRSRGGRFRGTPSAKGEPAAPAVVGRSSSPSRRSPTKRPRLRER